MCTTSNKTISIPLIDFAFLWEDNSVLLALVISPSDSLTKAYWWQMLSDQLQACDTYDELGLHFRMNQLLPYTCHFKVV